MPNRILRDWTDSDKINNISRMAELLLVRLIMKVDDYGRMSANPTFIKSHCFPIYDDVTRPQSEQITRENIEKWLSELEVGHLLSRYQIGQKCYLEIENFNQRLRQKIEKHPPKPKNDGQLSVNGVSMDGLNPEVESRSRKEDSSAANAAPPKKRLPREKNATTEKADIKSMQAQFYQELTAFTSKYSKDLLRAFFDYWSEPNRSATKIKKDLEKTWDLEKRLARWKANESRFGTSTSIQQPSTAIPV